MNAKNSWTKSFTRVIATTSANLWSALADTSNWKLWNAGLKEIQMKGAFAAGTRFEMELPDGEIVESELISVVDQEHFIDQTRVGDTIVQVDHRIERLGDHQCRVIYAVSADGPDAQAIGEAVSEDFPTVLESLERHLVATR